MIWQYIRNLLQVLVHGLYQYYLSRGENCLVQNLCSWTIFKYHNRRDCPMEACTMWNKVSTLQECPIDSWVSL